MTGEGGPASPWSAGTRYFVFLTGFPPSEVTSALIAAVFFRITLFFGVSVVEEFVSGTAFFGLLVVSLEADVSLAFFAITHLLNFLIGLMRDAATHGKLNR